MIKVGFEEVAVEMSIVHSACFLDNTMYLCYFKPPTGAGKFRLDHC